MACDPVADLLGKATAERRLAYLLPFAGRGGLGFGEKGELAGLDAAAVQSVRALDRTAAARWHPDKSTGDTQVFQFLLEAHHIVRFGE
ncbi:hypothetical protein ACH4VR_36165 [Streptomyces sp. NPDC020883]|uniref:hypothetical protein n=1 Tax=Streptomyces sp. NPDC020883 TaxID=3365099 RepID=UPI0037A6C2CF